MVKEKAALPASTSNGLLLAALRDGPSDIYADLSATSWRELTHLAARLGVSPMLYEHLRHINIPDEITLRLRNAYQRNTFSNMRLYASLRQIFEAFKTAGIPVMVLKGAFLAQAIYPNIALRTMKDADLLVRQEDLARAKEEMLALGYQRGKEVSISEQHLPPFYKPGNKRIEIHWTILAESSPFELDVADLWQRAQPVKIANVEVLGLCPEDLLLHLALHASYQHRLRRKERSDLAFGIRPFCDISFTIRHYQEQLDWQKLVQRALEWRASNALYLTLLLTQELLNAPIPSHVLSALKPANLPDKLAAQAKAQLFADRSQQPQIVRQTARLWGADGLREKARFVLESLFLPPDVMARMYPVRAGSPLMYLYYLVRLKYLLSQHGHSIWQLFGRQDQKMMSATQREAILLEWLSSPTDSV